MTYQEEAAKQVDAVQQQVIGAFAAFVAGTITLDVFVSLVAAFVAAGNAGAAALGDLSLAAAVTLATGRPTAALGIVRPATEPERLERAAETIARDLIAKVPNVQSATGDEPEFVEFVERTRMRLQRLADAEIRKAVAEAYAEGIRESEVVIGWTRGLEPEACQLCRWWWREGRVWDADHKFQHHKGCDCSQIIVTRKEDAA